MFAASARLGLAILVGAGALALNTGCRNKRPLLLEPATISVHYDTKYEATLNGPNSRSLLEEAWRPYVETLAEPAAIVAWRDGVSTWEVFYATNRMALPATSGTPRQTYGNGVAEQASFGRALVTLPRRQRGTEPAIASPGNKGRSPSEPAVEFQEVRPLAWHELANGVSRQLAHSRQRDLLLFVHGFNVSFESAVVRTAQISLDMPFNGAVVCYAWPTQGGIANYEADEPINAASVGPFTEFLHALLGALPAPARVNIVVHSMGNRLVMQAINRLPQVPGAKPLANVVLCAPDVGVNDFYAWAPGVVARSEQVTLYSSGGDAALAASKGLHAEARAGNAWPPLMVPGVTTIDCTAVDLDFLGHSYYGSNGDVLADLFAQLKQRQPVEQRPYLTQRQVAGKGAYWQYGKHAPKLLWTWNFPETNQTR